MATNPQDLVQGEDSEIYSIAFAASLINALWGIVVEKTASVEDRLDDALDVAGQQFAINGTDFAGATREAIAEFKDSVIRPSMPAAPATRQAPVVPDRIEAPALTAPPTLGAAPVLPEAPTLPDLPILEMMDATELQQIVWSNRDEVMALLKQAFSEFITQRMPPGTYFDQATAWLERVLAGGSAVDATVESHLWERDRARLTREAQAAEDEAMTVWAGRGYAMPPGALAHGVLTIRQGLTNAMSQQSRDIAIKAHQDEIDNAKFAVQQAIGVRTAAISAAINYMQALVSGPQLAMTLANTISDAQGRLLAAQAQLYSAEAGAESDIFKAVTGAKTDAYRTISGAQSDFYKAETGATADMYRARVDGWRAGVTAEADVYKAVTTSEADAYRTLVDALTRMYSTDVQAGSVPLDAVFKKAGIDFNVADANLKSKLTGMDAQVRAMLAASQQLATQAAAALNNLNVGTSVGNSTTTTFRQN